MTPKEILEKYHDLVKINNNLWGIARAGTIHSLQPYFEEPVIAYLTESIGFVFVIKTAKKFMAFWGISSKLGNLGGMNYTFARCEDLTQAWKMLSNSNTTIINDELFNKFKKTIMLDSLMEKK